MKEETSRLEDERQLLSLANQSTETTIKSIFGKVGINVSDETSLHDLLEKL